MVRFKNRYILGQLPKHSNPDSIKIYPQDSYINTPQQKSLLSHIKSQALQYHGQLLLSKIAFSLQIKYLSHGYIVVRVPRDHCTELVAALFTSDQIRVRRVSGTIRKVQKWLIRELRRKLGRELLAKETRDIQAIDYS